MLKLFKIISFVIPLFLIASFNSFAYSEKSSEQNTHSNQTKIGNEESNFNKALHAAINAGIYGPETIAPLCQRQ